MKQKARSLVALLLVLCLAAGTLPTAAEALPEWACAYTWFLVTDQYMNKPNEVIIPDYGNHWEPRLGYLNNTADIIGVALRDLDRDGEPELLLKYQEIDWVYEPGADLEDLVFGPPHSYIYGMRDHKVVCLGIGPGEWLVSDEHLGLFGPAAIRENVDNNYYWSYYWLNSSGNDVASDYELSEKIGTGEMVVYDLGKRGITPYSTTESDQLLDSLNLQWLESFRFFNPYTEPSLMDNEMDWLRYLAENYGIYSTYETLEKGYLYQSMSGKEVNRKVYVPFQKDPETVEEVSLTTAMFKQFSKAYHQDIAELGIVLSTAAYDQKGYAAGTNIYDAYHALGFDDDNIRLFNCPGHRLNMPGYEEKDHFRFSIASCDMGEYVLLVITLRGTGGQDVIDDLKVFNPYNLLDVKVHQGFADFMFKVNSGLQDYLSEHKDIKNLFRENKVKVLITGHSLGGAAANLLGAYYMQESVTWPHMTQENLFVYTFACPHVFIISEEGSPKPETTDCMNIFNVVIDEDPVVNAPARQNWYRFGRSYTFKTHYTINNLSDYYYYLSWHHKMENYIWSVYLDEPVRDGDERAKRWHDVVISDDPR